MSFRGLILSLAGLWGCAIALNAQAIPALPPCLFGQDEGPSCTVGAPFSFDLGGFFELPELASILNGITGADFTYSLTLTGGSLPPGLSFSPSGVISGTFTASGDYSFTITITENLTYMGEPLLDIPPVPIP